MKLRVAINGFGRIGRNFLRIVLSDIRACELLDIVGINIGPSNPQTVAHLFKYDTILGTFQEKVVLEDGYLVVNNVRIKIFAESDPCAIDWAALQVDWVVEASGKFTKRADAQRHITAGARHVLITAPAHDEDITIIPGVNSSLFDKHKHAIVSLGSCTTNAIVPMLKILHETFGIEYGFMTTVHAYTNSQVLLDVERTDLRRARAAALNIIPTTTGAMSVLDKVYPLLKGKIGGTAIRIPLAKVSLIDLTVVATKNLSVEMINDAFEHASSGAMRGIVAISHEPLVSSDYSCNSYSVTLDALLTSVRGNCGKLFGWYDNEWGYSERLKDFLCERAQ